MSIVIYIGHGDVMTRSRNTSRQKILAAAAELAREVGPANVSLDAVAARAGVSKGGLLYNFPSKAKLLESLVEQHLQDFTAALDEKEKKRESSPNSVAIAYVELFVTEYSQKTPPPSGVLAAMAENPQLLNPLRRFKRELLDRMKANASDEVAAVITFLALEGMHSMKLFDLEILSSQERENIIAMLLDYLKRDAPDTHQKHRA
jgi:AcrR family transcriptional regulator